MANMYVALCVCIYLYIANAEECPYGMQKRGDNCCKPVICEKNEDYRLCNDTHGEDTCIPCPPNTSNRYAFDTSQSFYQERQQNICKNTTEICVKTACLVEAKIENLTECLETGNFECVCNLDHGFYGHDPKSCQKWNRNVTELQRGFELTQDGLEECKQGYVKDKVGYGSCRPHRKCQDDEKIISNGNSTTDTQCGPLTLSTVSPDVNSTDGTPRSKGGMKDQVKIGVFVGFLVVAIMIGLLVIIWLVRNRRGRNRNDDNPENGQQNGGQRMEHLEQNVGQTTKPLILNGE